MVDGMPNALTVNGTAARIERAWSEAAPSVRSLTTAAMAASAVLAVEVRSTGVAAGWWGVCGALLALASLVDVREHRLPNSLLALALFANLVALCMHADLAMTARSMVGGASAGLLLGLVHLRRGVGMGDVKMAGVVGASVGCFGWAAPLVAVAAAAVAGAAYGAGRRRERIAFGPALWFGWALSLVGLSTGWWS